MRPARKRLALLGKAEKWNGWLGIRCFALAWECFWCGSCRAIFWGFFWSAAAWCWGIICFAVDAGAFAFHRRGNADKVLGWKAKRFRASQQQGLTCEMKQKRELPVRSSRSSFLCSFNFAAPQTRSTHVQSFGSSVYLAFHTFYVGFPDSVCLSMRMAHIMSKKNAFSTNCTFCHDRTSLHRLSLPFRKLITCLF